MPFNMVFGLDTIFSMEILFSTLCVVKELNWTGHELSERLEDLKILDKTRLAAVHGMYALKQRQKKFHDSNLSAKEFKIGDLVLLFTLKQFVSKFTTKWRRGRYVMAQSNC